MISRHEQQFRLWFISLLCTLINILICTFFSLFFYQLKWETNSWIGKCKPHWLSYNPLSGKARKILASCVFICIFSLPPSQIMMLGQSQPSLHTTMNHDFYWISWILAPFLKSSWWLKNNISGFTFRVRLLKYITIKHQKTLSLNVKLHLIGKFHFGKFENEK